MVPGMVLNAQRKTGAHEAWELGYEVWSWDWRTGESRVWDIGLNVSCRKLMLKLGFMAGLL